MTLAAGSAGRGRGVGATRRSRAAGFAAASFAAARFTGAAGGASAVTIARVAIGFSAAALAGGRAPPLGRTLSPAMRSALIATATTTWRAKPAVTLRIRPLLGDRLSPLLNQATHCGRNGDDLRRYRVVRPAIAC